MSTKIVKDEIRRLTKKGYDAVVDLVRLTSGPRGGNVAVITDYGRTIEANDAQTIVESIILEDKFENSGVEIARDIISRLKDGRSASLIFGQEVMDGGLTKIATGVNGTLMRRGIKAASEDVIEALAGISRKVETYDDIKNVASISSESKDYGKLIADTLEKIGRDGVISVEESDFFDVEARVTHGLEFNRGYISPWMVTDIERMEFDKANVPILVTDKKISSAQSLHPFLKLCAANGKEHLVIIADDIDGSALDMIIKSKLGGGISVLGIKIPGYGEGKKEIASDIALVTGATLVNDTLGLGFDKLELKHLGNAHRVTSTKEITTIVEGAGDKEKINERVKQLKAQILQLKDKYQIEQLEKRIASILGVVAVINVGADTESVRSHTKLKIKDAVAATKRAIETGIVAGGGVALVKVISKLKRDLSKESPEFVAGYKLVVKSLTAPFKQIVKNADRDDAEVMVRDIINRDDNYGYDAEKDTVVDDMFKSGIIDSLGLTQDGVKFATEAVGIFLARRGGTANYKDKV